MTNVAEGAECISQCYWPLTPCPKDERSDNSFNSFKNE